MPVPVPSSSDFPCVPFIIQIFQISIGIFDTLRLFYYAASENIFQFYFYVSVATITFCGTKILNIGFKLLFHTKKSAWKLLKNSKSCNNKKIKNKTWNRIILTNFHCRLGFCIEQTDKVDADVGVNTKNVSETKTWILKFRLSLTLSIKVYLRSLRVLWKKVASILCMRFFFFCKESPARRLYE